MLAVDISNGTSLLSEVEHKCVEALALSYDSKDLKFKVKKALGRSATPSSVFKVTSEIKRLSNTCNRRLDLRDAARGIEMQEFEFDGVIHVIDPSSVDIFKKLSQDYNNRYTFGVYEGVIKHFKRNKVQIKEAQIASEVDLESICFSNFYARKDERMNLAVAISFFTFKDTDAKELKRCMSLNLRKESDYKGAEQQGLTVNVSQSGLKIKTKAPINDSFLLVRFDGFEKDFVLDQKYIAYQVVKNEVVDEDNAFVFLKQLNSSKHKGFNEFLGKIIFANKRRYKVAMGNTIESVESSAYEQYFVSRHRGVFLTLDGDYKASYAGYAEPSNYLVDYFTVNGKFILPCLLGKDDLCLKSLERAVYLLVYKKGESFFSVPLANKGALSFFQYIADFDSAKLFKIETRGVDIQKAMSNTSTLPEHIQKKIGLPTIFRIAPRLEPTLSQIRYSLQLEELSLHSLSDWLKGRDDIDVSKKMVKIYNDSRLKNAKNSNHMLVKMESNDFRSEDRFFYTISVVLKTEKGELTGETVDISVKGMSIKLSHPVKLLKGDKVTITFNGLSDKYKKLDSDNIEYRIVGCSNGHLRCRTPDVASHDGRRLMSRVIYDNINTLTSHRQGEGQYGLPRVLRNILAQNHMSISSFFTVKEARPFTTKVALSSSHFNSSSYLNKDLLSGENLRFGKEFFYHQQMSRAITLLLGSVNQESQFDYAIVGVAKDDELNSYKMASCRVWLAKEFSLDKVIAFKQRCRSKEMSFYHMSLTRKSRVFDKYYRDELRYVSAYALYKAEQLEKEISRVTGLCQFNDISGLINTIT